MLEHLKTLYSGQGHKGASFWLPLPYTGSKHSPYNRRWVKLATCFLLAGAGYLLFQITDGFPPRAWRLLFNVLPQLPNLWAAQGLGVLLPLIALLLFSFSLLVLWSLIILGISQTLVLLWPATHQQERWQPNPDESKAIIEQQPSQAQPRLGSAYAMHSARSRPDRYYESPQQTPQWFEQQQSLPMSQVHQLQQSSSQQIQPLRGAVPAYEPLIGAGRRPAQPAQAPSRPHMRHSGAQHAHLRLIPEQIEPEQDFPEDPEELLVPAQDIEELELDTRPLNISEDRTAPNTTWDEDDDEQEATLRLVIGIGLDPGLVRKDKPNEDSLFAIQGLRTSNDESAPAGLFVIADGMGGHANGGDASRLAVREISNIIVPALLRDDGDVNRDEQDEEEFFINLLEDGVQRANNAIYQRNRTMPDMMGTTVTTALVVNTTAYIVNVGDSRTYLYRAEDGLVQITRDHSTVARLVEDGEIEPDDIYTHPQRNQIYRCLGEDPMIEMDTFVVPLEPDDILLLCSDGLWEMVRDPVMEKIIASSSHLPGQISNILVQAAINGGGADNISVVVVGVVETTLS
jgi:serine/threonine protein phosphatase PrpC